ncbi:MAG TPA: SMP-30/gluconolactonase/LRE family protein [Bryobacteraceae bacterium]|nr:SMP-30/gluconolactonase/LRE family protein [Bryobacteraceae bacterium]
MRVTRREFAVNVLGSLSAAAVAQEPAEHEIERVASGYQFTEGPAWSREGFLLFSDVPNNKIMKFVPGEPAAVFRENSNGANGNAFDVQGRLYSCESRTRRVVRADKKGNLQVLADKWEGKRFNAPNDIVVRKDGHVYFTDPAFGSQTDARELDFYGVYHITPKGDLSLIAKPLGRPNGIALTPNGHILYVANSDEHNVRAYNVDRNGDVSGERVVITGVDGVPDGLRVDEKGNVYLAANGIVVYNEQGKHLETIELAEVPSNCTFGDGDLETLYVTARTSLYRVRRNVKGALQY